MLIAIIIIILLIAAVTLYKIKKQADRERMQEAELEAFLHGEPDESYTWEPVKGNPEPPQPFTTGLQYRTKEPGAMARPQAEPPGRFHLK